MQKVRGERSVRPGAHGPVRERRRDARRVFVIALSVSVLLHLVATLTIRFRIDVLPYAPPTITVVPAEPVGTRVLEIVPTTGAAAPITEQLRARDDARTTFVAPAGDREPGDPRAGEEQRRIDPVGERLRPRLGHARVWTEPDATPPEPTDDERVRMRIADRLTVYNDSVRAEAEREERATDWTVRDGSGRRWGVSPGRIHLGDITVPAPVALATAHPMARQEQRARIVQWQEIRDQAERELVREMFDERARSIRARTEARRDSVITPPPDQPPH
jgi:hypothetical protein